MPKYYDGMERFKYNAHDTIPRWLWGGYPRLISFPSEEKDTPMLGDTCHIDICWEV